jgi:hypothetical protein
MDQHVLTVTEMARMGGLARAGKLNKVDRKAMSQKAFRAAAVNTVIRHFDELDQDQKERLTDAVVERLAS